MDAKHTKRVRDEEMGLEEHIARHRAMLVNARREVPALRARASALRAKSDTLVKRWQQRMACDMRLEAAQLEQEADVRSSMTREHVFEAQVVSYLRMYHKHSPKRDMLGKVQRCDEQRCIVDEYLSHMDRAPPKVAMTARDVCPRCEGVKLLLCASKSILSCPSCGHSVAYLDATSFSTSFDDVVDYCQYSYKKVSHFMQWVTLLQGKEAHRVPDDVMHDVMVDLRDRQKITDVTQITVKRVRDTLKALRHKKAYDHAVQITSRLSGERPMRLPRETEEQLRNMFLKMQPAFLRHAPKTRSNFLSYSYVLYRCLQILGLHEMCEHISLLKGRDKLEANDAIFRKMCEEDLGWHIPDLPPADATKQLR